MKIKSRIYEQNKLIDLGIDLNRIKKDLIKSCLEELKEIESIVNFSFEFVYGKDYDGREYIQCECIKF